MCENVAKATGKYKQVSPELETFLREEIEVAFETGRAAETVLVFGVVFSLDENVVNHVVQHTVPL